MYAKTLLASWADMDFNAHMRNTAFLDKSADVRMKFGPGPVLRRDSHDTSFTSLVPPEVQT